MHHIQSLQSFNEKVDEKGNSKISGGIQMFSLMNNFEHFENCFSSKCEFGHCTCADGEK